jgi:hypothetical protein
MRGVIECCFYFGELRSGGGAAGAALESEVEGLAVAGVEGVPVGIVGIEVFSRVDPLLALGLITGECCRYSISVGSIARRWDGEAIMAYYVEKRVLDYCFRSNPMGLPLLV